MSKRKKYIIIFWISLPIFFTALTFFIMGLHTDYLVKSLFKWLAFIILFISFVFIIVGIRYLYRYRGCKLRKKIKRILISLFIGIYSLGCASFLFILYGPYKDFRVWLITTAMATKDHDKYCKWFYSDEEIAKVLSENYLDAGNSSSDASLITHEATTIYANEYEEAVLKHDEKDIYKLITFNVNGCKAYLTVIYDPSKISVGVSKKLGSDGQYIDKMAEEQNAIVAINGGRFYDLNYSSNGANPAGVTIVGGVIKTSNSYSGWQGIIGFNEDNTLVLLKNTTASEALAQGVRDAVTAGPFLIINGKAAFTSGNGGWGYAARTAIGQRKDGIVLFLVVDSNEFRTNGATLVDLVEVMQNYGAVNAANLDGGTSSALVINNELINDPIDSVLRHKTRPIPTIFKVVE